MLKKVLPILTIFFFVESCGSSKEAMEILSFEKKEPGRSNDSAYVEQCKRWLLDKVSLIKIFKSSDTITAHDKNYIFNTLPCEYQGKVRIKGRVYNFLVNAGSYTVVFDNDSTYYLGYFKQDKVFFIDKPDTKQDGN